MEKAEQQLVWLEALRKENSNRWTIVACHYPVYSASCGRDNQRWREALKPLLE